MGRTTTRILVIDDAGLMRDGLRALLETQADFEVIGAVDNSVQEIRSIDGSDPAVVLIDVSGIGRATRAAVEAVRTRWPAARILMLGRSKDNRLVNAVLHSGIEGLILKSDGGSELLSAVRRVSQGKRYLAPSVYGESDKADVRRRTPSPKGAGPGTLTDRECEVMKLIAVGLRTREIADQLSLSRKTIEKHRGNLMRKLGLRTATAVAAYAIAQGYVVF